MLTVLESIKLSTEYLTSKGIESPRVNAELLLAHILGLKRLDLYLSFEKPLQESEIELYREYLKRRSKFEPLQYIIGEVEFFGLRFLIDKNVLIPRPETELLVEQVIIDSKEKEKLKILDIGTGSGNIAVSIAKNIPGAIVTAIDNSEKALETAKKNAELNGISESINFRLIDIKTDNKIFTERFDIVVSNPPYVSINDFETLQPEIKVFEPKYAVTDYSNGYSFYEIISSTAEKYLESNGLIYFEVGKDQSEKVASILKENNFNSISIIKDYQQIDRVIKGRKI